MISITFSEFEEFMRPIIKYDAEYEDCAKGLQLICKDSYAVPSLGGYLLGSYIDLLEKHLDIENNLISWFIYDNKYGEKGLKLDNFKINNLRDFYNFLTK